MNTDHSGDKWPTVTIDSDVVQSEEADVTVEVNKQFSTNTPAKIRIEYTNLSEERVISFAGPPPFCDITTTNRDGNRLFIIPDDQNSIYIDTPGPLIPDEPIDGCWQKPDGGLAQSLGRPLITFQAGESISTVYSLLDGGNDVCLPPGTYRFEEDDYFEEGEKFGFDVILEF